uniref:Uncharacterized protein n=2 Tax=Aegilops tauschii subsp. strangulata TaxID=200361 RepID=A0A453I722_AEGTS
KATVDASPLGSSTARFTVLFCRVSALDRRILPAAEFLPQLSSQCFGSKSPPRFFLKLRVRINPLPQRKADFFFPHSSSSQSPDPGINQDQDPSYFMSASNLRRRLHHADVDGRRNEHVDISHVDSLDEPLLGKSSYDGGGSEVYDPRRQDLRDDDDRKKEQLHWSFLFSNLIAQWAQWLANIIVSSGSIFGRLFPFSSDNETSNPVYLSPLQVTCGRKLDKTGP